MAVFEFKQFKVNDEGCAMKVGTDSVLLGAWTELNAFVQALDLGTGTGLLALMLAQRSQSISIHGLEIDPEACAAARSNFASSPWSDRLSVECTDVMKYCPKCHVDLLISNPPYFANGLQAPDIQRAQARHAVGHFGPLEAVELASRWLSREGTLAMVTPANYDDQVTYQAEMLRLNVTRKCKVSTIAGRPPTRILWEITPDRKRRYEASSLAIRDAETNSYTNQYKNLTKDYYLHL